MTGERVKLLVGDGGRDFIPAPRPKGYRKGRDKHCFGNAGSLALRYEGQRGRYVEGFALDDDAGWLHHAWLTLDGIHAIETTWDYPAFGYFGREYDVDAVAARAGRGWYQLEAATEICLDCGEPAIPVPFEWMLQLCGACEAKRSSNHPHQKGIRT
jgi:hypothetical protein